MFLEEYLEALDTLKFGKKTRDAIWLYRYSGARLAPELRDFIKATALHSNIPSKFNVLKLHKDTSRISFLFYPQFMVDPHPILHTAVDVVLSSRRASAWNFRDVQTVECSKLDNPPILHKKELLFPVGHRKTLGWGILTAYEEEAGLFDDPARIGNKLGWEALLKEKGLRIVAQPATDIYGYDKHVLLEVV